MSRAASTFRKSDVKRAILAAKSAGMTVSRVEIDTAGKIILVPDNGATAAAQPKAQDSLDDWMASHARSIEGY
jgi:hypothetical protein